MSRSVSSSPLRKKQRLSSPTYDAHFDDLDSFDFQVLDDIETRLSQGAVPPFVLQQNNTSDRKLKCGCVIGNASKTCEFDDHDDSGIMLVDADDSNLGSASATSCSLRASGDRDATFRPSDAVFLPASSISSAMILNTHTRRSPSPEASPEADQDAWFAPANKSLSTEFSSASNLRHLSPAIARKVLGQGPAPSAGLQRQADLTWASPSAAALEKAKQKLKVWESEIESELSASEHAQKPVTGTDTTAKQALITSREPLKGVQNSLSSASDISPTSSNNSFGTTSAPPRPFKAPALTTPRPDRTVTPASRLSRPPMGNPALACSGASTAVTLPGAPLVPSSNSPPITPSRLRPTTALPPPQTPEASRSFAVPRPAGSSQHQRDSPQRPKPLGLTPRAQAFTGSRARPKFVTPFKQGIKPGDLGRDALLRSSRQKAVQEPKYEGKFKEQGMMQNPAIKANVQTGNSDKDNVHHSKPSHRRTLARSGLTPRPYGSDELNEMGFDNGLFNITTISHFLYYRFSPANAEVHSSRMSLGPDSALDGLLAMNCHLATKEWVDNHWSLILWKMIGMACLEPATLEKRWCWDEIMRQLCYRYQRELASGSRPALRLITTQDAPSSGPIVLCVSDIFWTDEYVDAEGRLVPAHPELEITDGWYRLRATVDEALARATRNKVLRIGRKVACSGAKLESSKKDPMEVLDAYGNAHLVLFGNSTHLAPWHAKLGFQNAPFIATLGSLSSDGGCVPLVDLIVTQVFPVGFIEFITTENGELIREGPRTEHDDALEDDQWKDRRAHEAAKLQDEVEKKLHRLESYADKLERIAGSGFLPTEDESPLDDIESLAEELEDSEDAASIIRKVDKKNAGWLSWFLRKKCEADQEKAGDEIDRELATSFPPRQVRNFRVLRVKDARTVRKPSWRTAQLTVWDVMSLNLAEGGSAGSFEVGQRYMVTNLVPSQQSAWMGTEPGSEVYLSTRRDSKWRMIK